MLGSGASHVGDRSCEDKVRCHGRCQTEGVEAFVETEEVGDCGCGFVDDGGGTRKRRCAEAEVDEREEEGQDGVVVIDAASR